MVFGWLVLASLTALAVFAAVALAIRTAPSGRAELAVVSALGFFALIEAPVLVTGYTMQLYAPRLAVLSLVMSGGVFFLSSLGRGVKKHARATRDHVKQLAMLPLDAIMDAIRARSAVALGLIACAVVIGATLWISYLAPSEGWDALFYHEPIVGFSIQNHGFTVVDLPPNPMLQQVNGYPLGAECVPIWFVIFADRTFTEIGNSLAAPCLVVAVYAIARRYGDRVAAMGWGAVTLLIPGMWSQMRHAYIDVEITFFTMAALHFATRPALRLRDVSCMFLALALLVVGKGTGLVVAPPIALVAFVRLLLQQKKRRVASLSLIVTGTLALTGLAAITIVKNILVFKNPVWPVTYDMNALGLHFKGLIPYKAMNPAPPFAEIVKLKYGIPNGDVGDLTHHDYGLAVPWVVVPIGFVGIAIAAIAGIRDVLTRKLGLASNLCVVALLGLVAALTSNTLLHARFNISTVCVFMFAIVWLCKGPRAVRFGEAAVAAAIAMSIVRVVWVDDWYWGPNAKKIRELRRASHVERSYMYSDPGNMPPSIGRLREKELGPGDRVAFTQDESWLATLWNFQFSNQIKYVRYDDAGQFMSAIDAYAPKWVVVGAQSDARRAIESRGAQWEHLGQATPNDNTVVFQRR